MSVSCMWLVFFDKIGEAKQNTVECKSLCRSVPTIIPNEQAIYSNEICW